MLRKPLNCLFFVISTIVLSFPSLSFGGGREPAFSPPTLRDVNMDHIEDSLEAQVDQMIAEGRGGESLDVQIVFSRDVRVSDQLDFETLGGRVRHVYRHVLDGLAGSLPATRVADLIEVFGSENVSWVGGDPGVRAFLDDATQQVRVRPQIWDLGYEGSSNSAIAILDSGIDDSHMDLAGRIVAWHDATPDPYSTPEDKGAHGTHVASIAAGTGARYPATSGSLPVTTTKSGTLPTQSHYGWFDAVEVKNTGMGALSISLEWGGSGSTTVSGRNPSWQWLTSNTSSTPPNSISYIISTPGVYRPYLGNNVFAGGAYAADISFYSNGVGDGYRPYRGMAPGAGLVAVKVLEDDGHGQNSDVIAGLDWCVANRDNYSIRVINMSLGLEEGTIDPPSDAAVNNAVANGILVVCSAGNDFGAYTIPSPANASLSIAVGAVNDEGAMTYYSSNGAVGQGKPDVVAPGGSLVAGTLITAADSNDGDAGGALTDLTADNYTNHKGTSMAAPIVTGLAALLIDIQELNGDPWGASESEVLQIKKTILMTATETNQIGEKNWNGGDEPNTDSGNNPDLDRGAPDEVEGYGIVNADAAMEALIQEFDGGTPYQVVFGGQPKDRRAEAWYLDLGVGAEPEFSLSVPAGADFDLFLYEPNPDAVGRPVIAVSSTSAGDADELISGYQTVIAGRYVLVAKRVSGSGTGVLSGFSGTDLIFADGFENASTSRWSFSQSK